MYGNYLILSDTGAARDFIKKESFGHIIDSSIENQQSLDIMKKDLISHLQNIIAGKIDVEADKKKDIITSLKTIQWKILLKINISESLVENNFIFQKSDENIASNELVWIL